MPKEASYQRQRYRAVGPLPRRGGFRARPELREIWDWWNNAREGVCALLGPFGGGKSMLADRFITELQACDSSTQDSEQESPPPIFVCSFESRSCSAEFCFEQLLRWIRGPEYARDLSAGRGNLADLASEVHKALESELEEQILIVLDGIQGPDSGRRSLQGIASPLIQDLVTRAATGAHFGNVRWLITSWYPSDDLVWEVRRRFLEPQAPAATDYLLEGKSRYYHPIAVRQLPLQSCLEVLRDAFGLQVHDDRPLLDLAEQCGHHASILALLGSYIAVYCGGNPTCVDARAILATVRRPSVHPQTSRAFLDKHYEDLADYHRRVFQAHHGKLREANRPGFNLLERMCLFHRPPTIDLLTSLFLGEERGPVSGRALANLSEQRLADCVAYLERLHLIREIPGPSAPGYEPILALREYFLEHMGRGQQRAVHKAILHEMEARTKRLILPLSTATLSVPDRPVASAQVRDFYWSYRSQGIHIPTPYADLDALEERVFHLLKSGDVTQAATVALDELARQSVRLGDYDRVRRVVPMFVKWVSPAGFQIVDGLSPILAARLVFQWASAFEFLGRSSESVSLYLYAMNLFNAAEGPRSQAALSCAGCVLTLWFFDGKLRQAVQFCEARYGPMQRDQFIKSFPVDIVRRFVVVDILAARGIVRPACRLAKVAHCMSDFVFLPRLKKTAVFQPQPARYAHEGATTVVMPPWLGPLWQSLKDQQAENLAAAIDNLPTATAIADATKADLVRCLARASTAKNCLRLIEAGDSGSHFPRAKLFAIAARCLAEGLDIARRCGYGFLHIQMLTTRACLHLMAANTSAARRDALAAAWGVRQCGDVHSVDDVYEAEPRRAEDDATQRGFFPPSSGGRPELLAAMHPECGYVWAEIDMRRIIAEAAMMDAAFLIDSCEFDPAQRNKLGDEVNRLLNEADSELSHGLELLMRLDTQRDADVLTMPIPDLVTFQSLLKGLQEGYLPPISHFTMSISKAARSAERPGPEGTMSSAAESCQSECLTILDLIQRISASDSPGIRDMSEKLLRLLPTRTTQVLAILALVQAIQEEEQITAADAFLEVVTKQTKNKYWWPFIKGLYARAVREDRLGISVYWDYTKVGHKNIQVPGDHEDSLTCPNFASYKNECVRALNPREIGLSHLSGSLGLPYRI